MVVPSDFVEGHALVDGTAICAFGVLGVFGQLSTRPRTSVSFSGQGCVSCLFVAMKHAPVYGGDLDQWILTGESAGGNLVTGLTIAACYQRSELWAQPIWEANPSIRAVIPACAALQASESKRFLEEKPRNWAVRDRLLDLSDCYLPWGTPAGQHVFADPLVFLEEGNPPDRPLPPFFAFAGTADPILSDTKRLEVALQAMGVSCEAKYYPKGGHVFHAMIWKEIARQCWEDQFAFVRKHVSIPSKTWVQKV